MALSPASALLRKGLLACIGDEGVLWKPVNEGFGWTNGEMGDESSMIVEGLPTTSFSSQ